MYDINSLWAKKEDGTIQDYWNTLNQSEKQSVVTLILEGDWVGQCKQSHDESLESYGLPVDFILQSMSEEVFLELVDDAGGWCSDCGWVYPTGELSCINDELVCQQCKEYDHDDCEDDE